MPDATDGQEMLDLTHSKKVLGEGGGRVWIPALFLNRRGDPDGIEQLPEAVDDVTLDELDD
ncbi:MAG: hypothetical protein GY719_33275 [bacterium]|nr:hypothetical protein [bacterium]